MSRDEASWLVVRTLGLLFLIWAAYLLFLFALNLIGIALYEPPPHALEQGTVRLLNLDWRRLSNAVFLIGVSIYLLKFGRFAHVLLMAKGGTSDDT